MLQRRRCRSSSSSSSSSSSVVSAGLLKKRWTEFLKGGRDPKNSRLYFDSDLDLAILKRILYLLLRLL